MDSDNAKKPMKLTKAKNKEIKTENGEYSSDVINLLKLRRLYNKINNKKRFYELTGLTPSAMKYILDGNTTPTAKTISLIANFFNIPSGYLFNDYEKWHSEETYRILDETYKHCMRIGSAVIFYNDSDSIR